MLERPVEVTEQLAALISDSEVGRLDPRPTAEKILAIAPDHAPSRLLLALAMRQDGEMEGAEAMHWKAIDDAPCTAVYYLTLEETLLPARRHRSPFAATTSPDGLAKTGRRRRDSTDCRRDF